MSQIRNLVYAVSFMYRTGLCIIHKQVRYINMCGAALRLYV
jgi:hypothetical protein